MSQANIDAFVDHFEDHFADYVEAYIERNPDQWSEYIGIEYEKETGDLADNYEHEADFYRAVDLWAAKREAKLKAAFGAKYEDAIFEDAKQDYLREGQEYEPE